MGADVAAAAAAGKSARPSAVVFAYHNVGARALRVLLNGGVDVRLVVTHRDNPAEAIWFQSVAEIAALHGLPCIALEGGAGDEVLAACREAAPDFLFSFYFRHMIGRELLTLPRRGAFNLHGSLLPQFRGRAPVNWAVLSGATETGATLHVMDEKPDHGAIVDQCAVPILSDDTAREVFDKVSVAAEIVIARSLPKLVAGSAVLTEQRLADGRYFGGRKPEDGRIPTDAEARRIHDLVRAVAPPDYPGAFFDTGAERIAIGRTALGGASPPGSAAGAGFSLRASEGKLVIDAVGGGRLRVLAAELGGQPLDAARFAAAFGDRSLSPATPAKDSACPKS